MRSGALRRQRVEGREKSKIYGFLGERVGAGVIVVDVRESSYVC